MKFEHRFRVRAPISAVVEFHRNARSMVAITPPIVPIQVHATPEHLRTGDHTEFTMWLGPLPVRWKAAISNASDHGFTDHQLEGPFRYWIHEHSFQTVEAGTTEVVDRVHAGLQWNPFWGLVGLAMWLGLPVLFAYRGWKTRRLLENVESR